MKREIIYINGEPVIKTKSLGRTGFRFFETATTDKAQKFLERKVVLDKDTSTLDDVLKLRDEVYNA